MYFFSFLDLFYFIFIITTDAAGFFCWHKLDFYRSIVNISQL